MDHVAGRFGRKLIIVSGWTDKVEEELNLLLDSHTALTWNWDVVDGRHLVSVVLLQTAMLEKAMRMQQLAQAGQVRPRTN
jgi:hypothetical protein